MTFCLWAHFQTNFKLQLEACTTVAMTLLEPLKRSKLFLPQPFNAKCHSENKKNTLTYSAVPMTLLKTLDRSKVFIPFYAKCHSYKKQLWDSTKVVLKSARESLKIGLWPYALLFFFPNTFCNQALPLGNVLFLPSFMGWPEYI